MVTTDDARLARNVRTIKFVDFHNAMDKNDYASLGISSDEYFEVLDFFNNSLGIKSDPLQKQLQRINIIIFFLYTTKYIYSIGGPDPDTDAELVFHGVNLSTDIKVLLENIDIRIKALEAKYTLLSSQIVKTKNKEKKLSAYEMIANLALNIEGYLSKDITVVEYAAYYKMSVEKAKSLKN